MTGLRAPATAKPEPPYHGGAGTASVVRALVAGLALAAVMTGCLIRSAHDHRHASGTCAGACNHYVSCKRSDDPAMREQCLHECPEVFSDPASLEAFEDLSCPDTIEYVDGTPARISERQPRR